MVSNPLVFGHLRIKQSNKSDASGDLDVLFLKFVP